MYGQRRLIAFCDEVPEAFDVAVLFGDDGLQVVRVSLSSMKGAIIS